MAVTDISELRKKRKAKQTKNLIIKIFAVLLFCGTAAIAVLTKDIWGPYILNAVQEIPDNISEMNSAELAEGLFPIKVEGGMGYQLMNMDGALALLDDSRFHVYNADGKVMNESQHTFANPILCTAAGKALIYDEGGRDFRLESKYKTVYSNTADDVIYLAKLSRSDYAAVVTKSDKFLAMLKVYDGSGDPIFTYYSYDSRIINVTFTDGSTGCIVTVLTAENGRLMSKMIRFDFSDTEPKWISSPVPTLALDVRFASDGGIIMIGDTMTVCFDTDGKQKSSYTYKDPLTDFDSNGGITALITENTDLRRGDIFLFTGSDCSSPVSARTPENAGKVLTEGIEAYILSGSRIDIYSAEGADIGQILLEDDYESFCKNGKYIYLLGYDSVNRIDYNK